MKVNLGRKEQYLMLNNNLLYLQKHLETTFFLEKNMKSKSMHK